MAQLLFYYINDYAILFLLENFITFFVGEKNEYLRDRGCR